MVDLRTSFMGLELANPLVVGSCPLSSNPDKVAEMESAGAAAVVMRSIFEEQIREEEASMEDSLAGDTSAAAMEYMQAGLIGRFGTQNYLDTIADIRRRVKIPVIASINCVKRDSWVRYAHRIEMAGASAIELNLFHMPVNTLVDSALMEERRLRMVQDIMGEVRIPVALKLSPHYTSLPAFAHAAERTGVKALTLFNRFLKTDIDLEREEIVFAPDYSTPNDLNDPLRWVALLRGMVQCDLAISSGLHCAEGLAKALLAGANVGYVCSILYLRDDLAVIGEIITGLRAWMERKNYRSIGDFRGKLSEKNPEAGKGFGRVQYVKTATRL